jgi:rod shape-determining protein MreC
LGRKRLKFWLLLASLVVAPLGFFSTHMMPWGQQSPSLGLVQEISYPFAWAWHSLVYGIRDSWNHYVVLTQVFEKNDALVKENTELKLKLMDYSERVEELARLRQIAGFAERSADRNMIAEVLSGSRNGPFKTLRIAKGQLDGIKVGMPVITAHGVVGRILRIGSKFSDIQLMTDYDSNIDILIQRSRIRGVLSGFANQECRLHLQRSTEVKIGDTIVTSGLIGSFPKGLPVGRVTKISFETDNVSQIITVEPWVDHRQLEEVIVVLREDPDLERIIQTAGQEWIDAATQKSTGL